MRVFVTGASGFVGSAVVQELLQAGHQVLGLVRSETAAAALVKAGAEAYPGNLEDLNSLKNGAAQCDAVIHTAFNHDFSKYKENCENDRKVIMAIGEALIGTDRPLVITSGMGLLDYGKIATEDVKAPSSAIIPRAASEEAATALAEKGLKSYVVRLPPTVHGPGDHGFIAMVVKQARENGKSAYIGDGQNLWPAVHRLDAAQVYRLVVEQQPVQGTFHAVAEQGIPFKDIANTIGRGMDLETLSLAGEAVEQHFGWFARFAGINCLASSELTKKTLTWSPNHSGLLEDISSGIYFNS
ncbi:3-beta hydroxysteroid dehydrogenase [Chitinophaga caeni]|uniref:3-beta hydroxysteroid dehydrogenase n=1 Tax=Chitinophaga caeni TaxID=2029983 RepID=A0A291QS38_9BACT|nr:SDR family oxidoreductase [Chitinophaga caeni]ATL46735.1 3-beta hydroxysteroid dehydrogenase [Chitinophaga caeni]